MQNLQLRAEDRGFHPRQVTALECHANDGLSTRRPGDNLLVGDAEDSFDVRNSTEHERRLDDSWNTRLSRTERPGAVWYDPHLDHYRGHHCWTVPASASRVLSLEMRFLQATKARSDTKRESWEEQRVTAVHQQVIRGHLETKNLWKVLQRTNERN